MVNKLMQYLGIIAILLGVVVLGLYYVNILTGNGTLMTAFALMWLGLIGHIILNKFFVGEE
jgi:hypothetical protein